MYLNMIESVNAYNLLHLFQSTNILVTFSTD